MELRGAWTFDPDIAIATVLLTSAEEWGSSRVSGCSELTWGEGQVHISLGFEQPLACRWCCRAPTASSCPWLTLEPLAFSSFCRGVLFIFEVFGCSGVHAAGSKSCNMHERSFCCLVSPDRFLVLHILCQGEVLEKRLLPETSVLLTTGF